MLLFLSENGCCSRVFSSSSSSLACCLAGTTGGLRGLCSLATGGQFLAALQNLLRDVNFGLNLVEGLLKATAPLPKLPSKAGREVLHFCIGHGDSLWSHHMFGGPEGGLEHGRVAPDGLPNVNFRLFFQALCLGRRPGLLEHPLEAVRGPRHQVLHGAVERTSGALCGLPLEDSRELPLNGLRIPFQQVGLQDLFNLLLRGSSVACGRSGGRELLTQGLGKVLLPD
mmetsp:Transcript_38613/g.83563  ORF Transcript_38613/g.83563 Transcript_38613/m.83563 type:complete len:226 (-) Transcript_38613:612-1289(-)